MVVRDLVSAMLNDIMNCKRSGKKETVAMPVSKLMTEVLKIMKREGYIKDFKIEKGKFDYVSIEIGNLNKCNAIKPRFFVKKDNLDKYIRRFLPSRQLGILIVSTNKGLMTHREAIEKGVGGSLIAYCY